MDSYADPFESTHGSFCIIWKPERIGWHILMCLNFTIMLSGIIRLHHQRGGYILLMNFMSPLRLELKINQIVCILKEINIVRYTHQLYVTLSIGINFNMSSLGGISTMTDHNEIELTTTSRMFQFEKLSRDLDKCEDPEVLRNLLKMYIKLYLKQQETVASMASM